MAWTMMSSGIWPTNKGETRFTLWYELAGRDLKIRIDADGGDLIYAGVDGKEVCVPAGTSHIFHALH